MVYEGYILGIRGARRGLIFQDSILILSVPAELNQGDLGRILNSGDFEKKSTLRVYFFKILHIFTDFYRKMRGIVDKMRS